MKLYLLLFRGIIGDLRWRVPPLLLLMALVGLTEGLSVALLLPLLSRVGIAYGPGQGLTGAILNNLMAAVGASFGTLEILAILIAVAAIQAGLFIALQWNMMSAARGYQSRRQSQLFRALVRARWEFVIDRKAGELTSAIAGETGRIAQAFYIGLYLVATAISAVIYLIFALIIAWPVTLGLMFCALLITLALLRLYRESYALGKAVGPLNADLQSVLGERISGIKIVKATSSEGTAAIRLDQIVGELGRLNAKIDFMPAFVRGLLEFLSFGALATIFIFGQKGFGVAPGNVIVVFALFMRLFPRITTVQSYLHMLNGCLHAMDAVGELQSAAEAAAERPDDSREALRIDLPTSLVVRNLAVRFGERQVLDRISVTLPIPGMLAAVGESGAGKSTLVHAVLGLIEPSAGSIRLGSHELASAPLHAWRRAIGYVPQETILFHASIRDNLTLANPRASAEEVDKAARRAHAHHFIAALPEGYDTIIGDQGVKLSGGQRQRLGIARALLTNPVLLLMDEAMSALDAESEAEVLRTLEELRKEMGILIVAHRLAAVRAADCICVFEAGRVVESGSWSELMARRARLYALAQTQALVDDRPVAAL